MRRLAAVAAAVLLCALAGCAEVPKGVDGDLTNGWAAMPAATRFQPRSGTCHPDLVQTGTVANWSPVPCTGPHLTETIAVGTLARPASTPLGSQAEAFTECAKRATAFLGADWRNGWVVLQPVLPGGGAWAGGARWYRCDVAETSPVDGRLIRRTNTMKGTVRAGGTLRMACANPTIARNVVTEMHPVACSGRHTAEFAGLFETSSRRSADLSSDDLAGGCNTTIARFTGLTAAGSISSRVGWLGFPPDDTAWQMGDRAIRCFLWLNGEQMTGSYRNAGPGKLKIHYADR
jgi:hypothetical protein